jgi:hypothetical protein
MTDIVNAGEQNNEVNLTAHDFIRFASKVVIITLCGIISSLAAEQRATKPAPTWDKEEIAGTRQTVIFSESAQGGVSVSVNGEWVLDVEAFQKTDGHKNLKGVTFSWDKENEVLVIGSDTGEVILEGKGFEGWAAKAALGDKVRLRVDTKKFVIDVSTPQSNKKSLIMRFGDGAKAEVEPGSHARFDLFKDKSYYLSGSGKVHTINADGFEADLSPYLPPMTGGPVEQRTNDLGVVYNHRLSPVLQFRIIGHTNNGMAFWLDNQYVQIATNEVKRVELPNGSVATLILTERGSLDWKVSKGYFRVSIDGFRCWRATGLTDQAADHAWDLGAKAVDLKNQSPNNIAPPNRVIHTQMNRTTSAAVYPAATFQYTSIEDCQVFAGSSHGGRVDLYDSGAKREMTLVPGNHIVRPGSFAGALRGGNGPQHDVKISWESGDAVTLDGAYGQSSVSSRSRQTLKQPNGNGQMEVTYGDGGMVTVTAVSEGIVLRPEGLQNWSIEIPEGETVSLNLDVRKGLFTVQTAEGNQSTIRIDTGTGFIPLMDPDSTLSFIMGGREGSVVGGVRGNVIIYESAGAAVGEGVSTPGQPPLPNGQLPALFGQVGPNVNVSLIPPVILQPPATPSQ